MASRENISGIGLFTTYGPAAPTTGGAAPAGTAVNTAGFDSVALLIAVGAGGITFDSGDAITFKFEESNDNVNWSGVTQGEVDASYGTTVTVGNGGVVRTINTAHAAADVQPMKIGYLGTSQYVRAYPVLTGSQTTGTPMYLAFVLGNAHQRPVA